MARYEDIPGTPEFGLKYCPNGVCNPAREPYLTAMKNALDARQQAELNQRGGIVEQVERDMGHHQPMHTGNPDALSNSRQPQRQVQQAENFRYNVSKSFDEMTPAERNAHWDSLEDNRR
jgi:hypothetical protein